MIPQAGSQQAGKPGKLALTSSRKTPTNSKHKEHSPSSFRAQRLGEPDLTFIDNIASKMASQSSKCS